MTKLTRDGATGGGDDAPRFAPADDDPYLVDVADESLHAGTAKVDVPSSYEWRWPLDALRGVRPRRYLLRTSAVEIFLLDRLTYFLNLRSEEERARVYATIASLRPPRCAPMDASASGDAPQALLRRSDLTRRWRDREMSNFDYIMALNAVAGRTYNDVTQYPVFPWVIADYTSEQLRLDDPATYRDLSKPVGALNEARLARFRERHDAFDDPEIPKFHYGSHYSTAGTTIFYLIRLEPFTTLAHQLQGGKFDHADRLFDDVASTYEGVTTDMSDVKELVPEWYYLPEMFENVNRVDFGAKQSGRRVDDVRLPPWARDARDFVAKNRAALESEYVSEHLHLWIDLIFGYKQRGAEATEADNVFYYLTYEGAVDVDAIENPTLLKATQDQIANFGQTPSQLLTKPHRVVAARRTPPAGPVGSRRGPNRRACTRSRSPPPSPRRTSPSRPNACSCSTRRCASHDTRGRRTPGRRQSPFTFVAATRRDTPPDGPFFADSPATKTPSATRLARPSRFARCHTPRRARSRAVRVDARWAVGSDGRPRGRVRQSVRRRVAGAPVAVARATTRQVSFAPSPSPRTEACSSPGTAIPSSRCGPYRRRTRG